MEQPDRKGSYSTAVMLPLMEKNMDQTVLIKPGRRKDALVGLQNSIFKHC